MIDPNAPAYLNFPTNKTGNHTVRSDIAKACMQGLLADGWAPGLTTAESAVRAADLLIAALNNIPSP